jgi:hypothetical protein
MKKDLYNIYIIYSIYLSKDFLLFCFCFFKTRAFSFPSNKRAFEILAVPKYIYNINIFII